MFPGVSAALPYFGFIVARQILVLWLLAPTAALAGDGTLARSLENYLNGLPTNIEQNSQIGIAVLDADSGDELASRNGDTLLMPASVMKIFTSVAALKLLGSDYRFPTEIFAERSPTNRAKGAASGDVGRLFVRGYGDPSLVNESIWNIADELARRGVRRVKDIVIDDTLFVNPQAAGGSDPYLAALSATSVNFNNYAISIAPGRVGESAYVSVTPGDYFKLGSTVKTVAVSSDDIRVDQDPPSKGTVNESIPLMESDRTAEYRAAAGPIAVKVSGTIGAQRGLITLYQTAPDPASYLGGLLGSFLRGSGIQFDGKVLLGVTPRDAQLLTVYRSRELAVILRDLNQFSNNFIAGQLLYAMGQEDSGVFSRETALRRIAKLFSQIGIAPESYQMLDGSGLDRGNRLSVRQLSKVLVRAYQDFSIAPDLISSLSRYGHTGTLKNRDLLQQTKGREAAAESFLSQVKADSVWGKTGTLDGVSSLAGYAVSHDDRRLVFAILINGGTSKQAATEIEDGLLRVITGLKR